MADSMIQLSPDSTGKKVDTEELTVGLNSVHRERMQIAGDSPTDIAPVTAADGLTVNLGTNNDVTVASLPLPAGAATLAEQQTQSTALTAIETSVQLLDNAIAGSEMQVDVVTSALPTGAATAALQTQPGVDIGDVTVNNAAGASAVNVQDGGNSLTVDGAVTANAGTNLNTSALALEAGGNLAAAAASLNVMDDWDETNRAAVNLIAGQVGVQGGSGAINALTQRVVLATDQPTVPVSMASGPLPSGAATEAKQDTQITHLATIAGDTTDIEAAVELIDDTVKTLGTDTYTEATTKGLLIGGVRRDADTTLVDTTNEIAPFQVDARGFIKVEAFSGETLPISGTVTANAGTNLNTSALALETGGNLAAAAASLSVIDDWDETDRAKVNPIVGQAGVAAGAGAVSATVQRTTLASDDPAVTALQIMDDWDETNRAAVNTIAGQVGVQGASGAVTALTQRVVLATDVALPAGTNNIGDVDVLTMPVTEVVGDVAADAAVPANPLSIGGRASTALPTAVSADGDSVYAWLNRNGLQVVSMIPGAGMNADPYTQLSVTAQYTGTQTSAVLLAGGASERIIVTSIQIQVGGTTAGTLQVYFGTGAYSRGTNSAIFDGEFAPSATLKPGFFAAPAGGFRSPTLGHDVLVTDSAAINPLTITIWYYILGV